MPSHLLIIFGVLGCKPIWVSGEYNEAFGLVESVSANSLRAAFHQVKSRGMRAAAALIVSPTYYGSCSGISGTPTCSAAVSHVIC